MRDVHRYLEWCTTAHLKKTLLQLFLFVCGSVSVLLFDRIYWKYNICNLIIKVFNTNTFSNIKFL